MKIILLGFTLLFGALINTFTSLNMTLWAMALMIIGGIIVAVGFKTYDYTTIHLEKMLGETVSGFAGIMIAGGTLHLSLGWRLMDSILGILYALCVIALVTVRIKIVPLTRRPFEPRCL